MLVSRNMASPNKIDNDRKRNEVYTNNANSEVCHDIAKDPKYFAWFMMSSACLSHGAQGQEDPDCRINGSMVSYSNFELGVLFCSRLQGDISDRIYAWNPGMEKQRVNYYDIVKAHESIDSTRM